MITAGASEVAIRSRLASGQNATVEADIGVPLTVTGPALDTVAIGCAANPAPHSAIRKHEITTATRNMLTPRNSILTAAFLPGNEKHRRIPCMTQLPGTSSPS